MRFLILDTHYSDVLRQLYENHPGLEARPYSEQLQEVYNLGFARADSLPLNLRRLGHEAKQVIVNAAPLQRQWAEGHGLRVPPAPSDPFLAQLGDLGRVYHGLRRRLGLSRASRQGGWEASVVAAQVEKIDPDIIFNCDPLQFTPEFLWRIRGGKRWLIGECACPIPPSLDLRPYDLLVSCAPHYVERFRRAGARAELLRQAFEPSILSRLDAVPNREGVVFIGSLTTAHARRIQSLDALSRRVPLSCWGAGADRLSPDSPLRGRVRPPLWGYEMYRELQHARIALNIHIDVAEDFAGNMRLFEVTGVGTLLLTDWKENLHEMFQPGKDVIAYRTPEECMDLIRYYLEHDDERAAIAAAGHERTLRDHTYLQRAQELVDIVERYLRQPEIGTRTVFA